MIENYEQLASSPLRKDALDILIAGITRVMPKNFMPDNVSFDGNSIHICGDTYDLRGGNLYVIGGGKAAGAMAVELEQIVTPTAGIVNDLATDFPTRIIRVHKARHPVPSAGGVAGVRQMLELTRELTKRDMVVCLISGGGSAMMTCPAEGITLGDIQELTRLLLEAGLTVQEINVIRKHLSRVKGGKLARHLQPARVIGLIVSDTLSPEDETASGPTSVDRSSFEEAHEILMKYRLAEHTPVRILDHLEKGLHGEVPGNVRSPEEFVTPVRNYVLADNTTALLAMRETAIAAGYEVRMYPERLAGEARDAASRMAQFCRSIYKKGGAVTVVSGGETTVTVRGAGRGGRNQEYVAGMIQEIGDCSSTVVASIGTDGVDFLKGVGGAIITDSTLERCRAVGLDPEEYLRDNNTYALHRKLGSLIKMKPTHTNVADISVYLWRVQLGTLHPPERRST